MVIWWKREDGKCPIDICPQLQLPVSNFLSDCVKRLVENALSFRRNVIKITTCITIIFPHAFRQSLTRVYVTLWVPYVSMSGWVGVGESHFYAWEETELVSRGRLRLPKKLSLLIMKPFKRSWLYFRHASTQVPSPISSLTQTYS